ncbi:UNVERIFIED_CONTAM: hypothetical protein HDU68_002703 [Siphonaria sp. JEL0065]|nr:hypothetical protein HDU68_002703 [Siphonaria sp. JEL0065]
MALSVTTGNRRVVSEFSKTSVFVSNSLVSEPTLALRMRNNSTSRIHSGVDKFGLYSPTATEVLEIVEDAGASNTDVQFYLHKDLLLIARNLIGSDQGKPVIDGRQSLTKPFVDASFGQTSLKIHRLLPGGRSERIFLEEFPLNSTIKNPCCNDYLLAVTDHANPSVGSKSETKQIPTIREKLMHALKSDRVTTIRIKRIAAKLATTKLAKTPETKPHSRSSSGEFSITDYCTDSETEVASSSNTTAAASSPSSLSFMENHPISKRLTPHSFSETDIADSSTTQSVLLDLSARGLNIHGISLTRWHLIIVSTKFQSLHKSDSTTGASTQTLKGGECLVKVVLSVYSLKTIDLVTEISLNELSYTQRNRLFKKVKVCHAVCSLGRRCWVWLEGVEIGGSESKNPLMRHASGGGEEVESRPEMVCLDVVEGTLRVFERRSNVLSGGRGKVPWIKWRRGLEVHGSSEKGAWVFYKVDGGKEEGCCYLKLC